MSKPRANVPSINQPGLNRYRCWIHMLWFAVLLFNGCMAGQAGKNSVPDFEIEKDYDGMVAYYHKAYRENPDNLDLKLRLEDARQKASLFHMAKGKELMEKKYYKEAIEELQIGVAFYASNHKAIELIETVKKKKESEYHYQKGVKQIQLENFQNARKSFMKAVELDPENIQAAAALEQFKKQPEELPLYRLDLRTNDLISLKFKETPVLNVFEILSKLTGINFIFDKDIKTSKVTLFMTDVKFDRFLDVLLKTNALRSKMINQKTLLIYPDTPAKSKEYDDLYVRTFYLSYLKAKQAVAILTKILKSKNIIANDKLNAVTIRGSKDRVDMAQRIIEANDRTPSEVVLNVEIMEVSRTKEKDLGLSITDTITFGLSETSSGIDYNTSFGFAGMASIKDLSKITRNELYLSLPTATLKLLKKDGDTRILAKPQIRVSSAEKASILIGEKVPLRSNRKVQTDGTTTYDFQYQDVGVKLTAEPVINMYDQVTLKLAIEISALGNNVGTVNDPQYSIKTRTTDTVLTINDGDSVIIGGLIEDEDRSTIQKIPMVGEIPAIGRLFSNENAETIKTDILMTITPVIIRAQDVPERHISQFWSGSEKQVSFDMPMEEKIIQETDFKDTPKEDYIMVVSEDEFLPTDEYFSIQVFSAKDEQEADKQADLYEEMGYETWMIPADLEERGTYFRIFIGQFGSYHQAENARHKMLATGSFAKDIHIVDRAYVYGE